MKKLIEAFQNPETRAKFLSFAKYKDAKKFIRVDMGAGSVADNGQHFLDIMTKTLASTPEPALHAKWNELRDANREYRKKRKAVVKHSKK